MTQTRSKLDMGRLAAVLGKFGADARAWVALARVNDLGFDADSGMYADVTYLDTGVTDTVLVGSAYAGASSGLWAPLTVGDLVVVVLAGGDSGVGAVIVARLWSGGRPPPEEAQSADDPETTTADVVLRVRASARCRVLVDGDGAIEIRQRGAGEVRIAAADGPVVIESSGDNVYLGGDSGTDKVALATELREFLVNFKAWAAGHTHAVPGVQAGPATVTSATTAATVPDVPVIAATKVEAK